MPEITWLAGTEGRLYTHHRGDGRYSARAVLTHDSPPDQEEITVELIDDFYCLGAGETTTSQRYLFEPAE